MGNEELFPVVGLGSVALGDTVNIYGVVNGLTNFGIVIEIDIQI
jgi:hypothetical protein